MSSTSSKRRGWLTEAALSFLVYLLPLAGRSFAVDEIRDGQPSFRVSALPPLD